MRGNRDLLEQLFNVQTVENTSRNGVREQQSSSQFSSLTNINKENNNVATKLRCPGDMYTHHIEHVIFTVYIGCGNIPTLTKKMNFVDMAKA